MIAAVGIICKRCSIKKEYIMPVKIVMKMNRATANVSNSVAYLYSEGSANLIFAWEQMPV